MVLCFVATSAVAQQAEGRAQERNCDDPLTQTDMNICAYEAWEEADRDLNAAYRVAIAKARQMDAGRIGLAISRRVGAASDGLGTEEALRAAQRAWIVFRDNACLAESDVAFGGTLQPLLFSGCSTDLTRQRTTQLRLFAEDI